MKIKYLVGMRSEKLYVAFWNLLGVSTIYAYDIVSTVAVLGKNLLNMIIKKIVKWELKSSSHALRQFPQLEVS